jgi:hypothetical protein
VDEIDGTRRLTFYHSSTANSLKRPKSPGPECSWPACERVRGSNPSLLIKQVSAIERADDLTQTRDASKGATDHINRVIERTSITGICDRKLCLP